MGPGTLEGDGEGEGVTAGLGVRVDGVATGSPELAFTTHQMVPTAITTTAAINAKSLPGVILPPRYVVGFPVLMSMSTPTLVAPLRPEPT